MLNVKEPDTRADSSKEVLPLVEGDMSIARRWPIIRGRTWRVVLCVGPLGVRLELERTDHAQS